MACPLLDFIGKRFDEIGPGKRIDRIGDPGLVAQDLLGPQGEFGRALGGQPERFVESVRVQTLGPAERRRQRLERDAYDVGLGLLSRQR